MNLARRFLVTGARGAFGRELTNALQAAGASVATARFGEDWTYGDYGFFSRARLAPIDVLVLSHGAKGAQAMAANCTSFVEIAERYRHARGETSQPAEIWGLGSEIELHPAFGATARGYLESKRAYARYAARLYGDDGVTYRHIVPAAFRSGMGPGPISARTAVRIALFFLARDWKYVPVTYTGMAWLNYLRFRRLSLAAHGRG
ncbi:MAG TPA: hypothetical protein VMN56_13225 [Casimicrobiaceae bacterium]|nr:hypothetical protein [Casimicrobiaceae bacterium]